MAEQKRVKTFCPECGGEYTSPKLDYCPEDGARLRELNISSDADDPLLGEVLDERFRIDSILGEGGMGRVYVGEQLSVERPVAIKTLRPQVDSEEIIVKRFMRESRVISKLTHPNIVNLVDFGRDGNHELLYLVLELVDGIPADELLEGWRLAPELAVHIAGQVCGGLSEAHGEGVIHRDLKPENLMLVPLSDGRIETKLLDFGVAHAVQENNNLTASGSVWGTPYYMAPEQAEGKEVGPFTDVYAVGVMLFKMLTGHVPVSGESTMEILIGHINGRIPRVDSWLGPDEVPASLVELLVEMTAKAPEDRPDSILEVRKRLNEIARETGWRSIFVDPESDVEEMFAEWLLEPVSPKDQAIQEGAGATTGAGQAVHRTGEYQSEGSGEQVAFADTMASGPNDAPGGLDTGGAEASGQAASGGGETGQLQDDEPASQGAAEEMTEGAFADEMAEARGNSHRRLGLIAGGLLLLVGLVGGAVYGLMPADGEDGSGNGVSSGEAKAVGAGPADDESSGETSDETSTESETVAGEASAEADTGERRADGESDAGGAASASAGDAAGGTPSGERAAGSEEASATATGSAPGGTGGRAGQEEESTEAASAGDEPSGAAAESSPRDEGAAEEETTEPEPTAEAPSEPSPDPPDEKQAESPAEPADDSKAADDESGGDDSSPDEEESVDPGFFPAE